MALAHAAV